MNISLGALYILFSATAYACMGALVKVVGHRLPDEEMVFMRSIVCLLTILPWMFYPKRVSFKTRVLPTHLIRGTAGFLNIFCFFYSIQYIMLTDAVLLNNTMPLFLPLILWVWKRDKIPMLLIPGLVIGFLGVVLILNPGHGVLSPAALLALASGFFMSISMAGIRELSRNEPVVRIMFYYFLITTCISAIPLIWTWETPTPFLWLLLVGIGVFAAAYQFFLTLGYSVASAVKVSPIIYFAVILSGLFDWVFWDKIPPVLSYVGVVLVITGAIICIRTKGKRA